MEKYSALGYEDRKKSEISPFRASHPQTALNSEFRFKSSNLGNIPAERPTAGEDMRGHFDVACTV